jgi:hypothetical protein
MAVTLTKTRANHRRVHLSYVYGFGGILSHNHGKNLILVIDFPFCCECIHTHNKHYSFRHCKVHQAYIKIDRILLAFGCSHNIKLYQMDVKSASLNNKINELVYIEQLCGFEDSKN